MLEGLNCISHLSFKRNYNFLKYIKREILKLFKKLEGLPLSLSLLSATYLFFRKMIDIFKESFNMDC